MKKILILFIFLILLAGVRASPVISNFSVEPKELWMEDDLIGNAPKITLNRNDDETNVLCYSNMTAPDGTFFGPLKFSQISPKYYEISSSKVKEYLKVLNLRGMYNTFFYCTNSSGYTSNTESDTFFVYNIETFVSISPNPLYIGEEIKIVFDLKENGQSKENGVEFQLELDGEAIDFRLFFKPEGEYILGIDNPNEAGDYDLKIKAYYKGNIIVSEEQIIVKEPIQFEIVNLNNKTEVKENDNITINVRAFNKNSKLGLEKNYLTLKMDSVEIDSDKFCISSAGSTYDDIILITPNLSPGQHILEIGFNYEHFSFKEAKKIFCVIPISGNTLNYNNDVIHTTFTFSSTNIERKINTVKNGSYYGFLSPGRYDILVEFPESTLVLKGVDIDEDDFNDIVTYNYFDDKDVFGIRGSGVFFYDISPGFSSGSIEMRYNRKYITDEDNLQVYGCGDWDSVDKECDDEWEKVDFEIDEGKQLVKVSKIEYSAYIIGNEKSIKFDFSTDKKQYYLEEMIAISGIVKDDINSPIADADVNVKIEGKEIAASGISKDNGIISFNIPVPDGEGNYTLLVSVEKYPYTEFTGTTEIVIIEKKEISVLSPQTIRVEQGKNSTVEISIINIGQTGLSDVYLVIEGIPNEYYSFNHKIDVLGVGEEKKIKVNFMIPVNTSEGTFNGKFKVEYSGKYKEEIFGFSILPKSGEQIQTSEISSENKTSISGKFVLPQISLPDFRLIYMVPIALASFVMTFLFKKSKKKPSGKEDKIGEMFSEIKLQIRGKNQERSESKSKK